MINQAQTSENKSPRSWESKPVRILLNVWGLIFWRLLENSWQWRKKKKTRWIISLLSFPFPPRSSGTCSFAALKCCPVTPEGPRGSSPAGNQPSFFHEAVSVQESLWISPAASASNTSCYTLGNMTTALPPSSLHLNALQHPVTPWVKSDLSPLVSRELRTMANGLLMTVLVKEINWNQTIILWLFAPPSDDICPRLRHRITLQMISAWAGTLLLCF